MLRRYGLALVLALAAPEMLSAQYFGQNKVQYNTFDFQIIQTEHFDVYFYPRERAAALDAARMAERSYGRLSRVLNHRFRERKPIILYASHSDFAQTNTTPGDVGEGTGGFTDFFRQRNILPLTGSYAENEHVLTHEMVHQFQFDVFSRGRTGAGISTLVAVNPPLWFMEGMAEYLSIGPIDPNTAMWLRDAALENRLPTIEQLTNDPRVFPYRFGHALMSYIGERWGDEAIGAVLQGTLSGGIEGSIRRTLGLSLNQLSAQWRDAVQRKYLPEIGSRPKARAVADELLTEKRSDGTLHLAPALSPDGSQVAYFSEKDFYFVDLYLADGNTGKVIRRLLKSTFSSNYETFRFINSQASWSPDGKFLAFAAKRGPRDDIVIVDVKRNKQVKRIEVELNGVTTPSWSPDGERLVFTGYDGGISDLFVVNRDGSGLRRLTEDKYADLHPVWSPDGKSIAFATDRGPGTNFTTLELGNFRIALLDIESGSVRELEGMESGRNSSPVWAPDGRSLAFVSDRNGVSNIFLYDLDDRHVYQLTDFYTGVSGITPLSPVMSWARDADRLAFNYYEKGQYDVYTLTNPRSLKRRPYEAPTAPDSGALVAHATGSTPGASRTALATTPLGSAPLGSAPADSADSTEAPVADSARAQVGEGGSIYRSSNGFRAADQIATGADSGATAPAPVSVVALLDSASLSLPDTSEFTFRPYHRKFSPDYFARPQVGFVRDNFGRGFFGGSAVALSDMLGNHQLVFAGFVNGRLAEAQVLASYANLSRRVNWAVGASQEPYFFIEPSEIRLGSGADERVFVTNIRRLVVRSAFGQAFYPLSRFQRIEAGMRVANVNDAVLSILEPYSGATGFPTQEPFMETTGLGSINYLQPNAALVFDNTVFGYVGPFVGRRYRFEFGQSLGDWRFSQITADYRRYDKIVGPVVLATRGLYFGRIGRDAQQFRIFAGIPDLLRGHTSGSYRRNECRSTNDLNTATGCVELDRLVGTQVGVATAELRFPILNPSMGIPLGIPPIEGALFYEVGMAWDDRSTLRWNRKPGDDPVAVRSPLQTIGFSIRTNLLGFAIARVDYSVPQNRPGIGGLWTVSLGPTF
jgi:Tol biopolymer transport system component